MRGQKAVNLEVLETLLARFSQLLADFPEIQEVDLNPVLAAPERGDRGLDAALAALSRGSPA